MIVLVFPKPMSVENIILYLLTQIQTMTKEPWNNGTFHESTGGFASCIPGLKGAPLHTGDNDEMCTGLYAPVKGVGSNTLDSTNPFAFEHGIHPQCKMKALTENCQININEKQLDKETKKLTNDAKVAITKQMNSCFKKHNCAGRLLSDDGDDLHIHQDYKICHGKNANEQKKCSQQNQQLIARPMFQDPYGSTVMD